MSDTDLQAIYTRHRQALFTLALSRTRHRQRAEDAVHEAFVRLCRRGLNGASDPVAYVFAAVRNAAVDQGRAPRLVTDGSRQKPVSLFRESDERPDEQAIGSERVMAVRAAIDALPVEQREVLVLRIYGDLNFAQVAQIVGSPIQTVFSRYQRALRRLKDQLEKLV